MSSEVYLSWQIINLLLNCPMCRLILDEVEIRELLIDHVGHRCCWGSRPARRWKISAVEDCNVYVGTLDTFIEERDVIKETEPYRGGAIDGRNNGPELGIWELDLKSEFPLLFVPSKESRKRIPHSETVEKCSGDDPGNYISSYWNAVYFVLNRNFWFNILVIPTTLSGNFMCLKTVLSI